MKKKILVLCPFPQGVAAGQRLKYEQYFDRWRSNGWEVNVSPFMDKKLWKVAYKQGYFISKLVGVLKGYMRRLFDLYNIPKYDLIYIFMNVTPFFTSSFERIVRFLSKSIIYDIEDNIHTYQKYSSKFDPNPISKFIKWPGKVNYLIRTSDHVITSSPFLNEDCLKINKKKSCSYISCSLDTNRFQPRSFFSNDKIVVIGWTGTYSSKQYLDQLRAVFLRLAERVKFKLNIIGNFKYDLPGIDLDVIEWKLESEIKDLHTFDIGIYPLPLNNWVLGKSGLKAIQYMALGIPCVATNVGTTKKIITDNINGRLVKNEDEWVDALEDLVKNPQTRHRIGQKARIDAVNNYSTNIVGNTYDNILSKMIKHSND